jgi:hypothetical protein
MGPMMGGGGGGGAVKTGWVALQSENKWRLGVVPKGEFVGGGRCECVRVGVRGGGRGGWSGDRGVGDTVATTSGSAHQAHWASSTT